MNDIERDEKARAAFLAATEYYEAGWTPGRGPVVVLEGSNPAAFVPPPPKPAPPPQAWDPAHRALAERHRDGDFESDGARAKPGLAGFLAAMAQSYDYGAPIRSSAAGWEAHAEGNGAIGTAGFARPPDSMTAREEYSLAHREIARVAMTLRPATVHSGHVFDGPAQMAMWTECHGPGALTHRTIRGGPARKVKGMGAIPASPIVTVPERRKRDATTVSEALLVVGIVATPHEVGLICRRVTGLVESAFIQRGWVRARRVPMTARVDAAAKAAEGGEMAMPNGYDRDGWKEISSTLGYSVEKCREWADRAEDPLPVYVLGKRILAKANELQHWLGRQVQPRSQKSA